MKFNIDPDWLLQMAEKEDNGIVSVGGFFTQVEVDTDPSLQTGGRIAGSFFQGKTIESLSDQDCQLLEEKGGRLIDITSCSSKTTEYIVVFD